MSCNCRTTTFIPVDEIASLIDLRPMPRPIAVEARDNYRVWVKYDDGAEGEIDYSDIPRDGVFEVWNDPEFFKRVHISDYGAVAWPGELDLCPDSAYMRLTGKTVEELMPALAKSLNNARTV